MIVRALPVARNQNVVCSGVEVPPHCDQTHLVIECDPLSSNCTYLSIVPSFWAGDPAHDARTPTVYCMCKINGGLQGEYHSVRHEKPREKTVSWHTGSFSTPTDMFILLSHTFPPLIIGHTSHHHITIIQNVGCKELTAAPSGSHNAPYTHASRSTKRAAGISNILLQ